MGPLMGRSFVQLRTLRASGPGRGHGWYRPRAEICAPTNRYMRVVVGWSAAAEKVE